MISELAPTGATGEPPSVPAVPPAAPEPQTETGHWLRGQDISSWAEFAGWPLPIVQMRYDRIRSGGQANDPRSVLVKNLRHCPLTPAEETLVRDLRSSSPDPGPADAGDRPGPEPDEPEPTAEPTAEPAPPERPAWQQPAAVHLRPSWISPANWDGLPPVHQALLAGAALLRGRLVFPGDPAHGRWVTDQLAHVLPRLIAQAPQLRKAG